MRACALLSHIHSSRSTGASSVCVHCVFARAANPLVHAAFQKAYETQPDIVMVATFADRTTSVNAHRNCSWRCDSVKAIVTHLLVVCSVCPVTLSLCAATRTP